MSFSFLRISDFVHNTVVALYCTHHFYITQHKKNKKLEICLHTIEKKKIGYSRYIFTSCKFQKYYFVLSKGWVFMQLHVLWKNWWVKYIRVGQNLKNVTWVTMELPITIMLFIKNAY